MSRLEISANARAWHISGSASASTSHGYIRAILVRNVYTLPRSANLGSAPARAAYVVSRVSYGYLFEMRVSGERAAVSATVDALVAQGSVSAEMRSARAEGITIGLTARGDEMAAMTASGGREIQAAFEADGDPVPILVEFQPLTRTAAPERRADTIHTEISSSTSAPRYQISVVAIEFPARKPGNNWAWDAMGGEPDMRVDFSIGGRQVFSAPAPRNTHSYRFPNALAFPAPVTIDAGSRMLVKFWDVDGLGNDPAGSYSVSSLQSGDQWITASSTARVLVRVQRLE